MALLELRIDRAPLSEKDPFEMITSLGIAGIQLAHTFTLSHFFITLILLLSMILVARTVVAGTKYSSILIIVVFGLLMGYLMVRSGLDVAGFPILRHWYILQRKGKRLSPAAQAFRIFVLEQAREFIRLPQFSENTEKPS